MSRIGKLPIDLPSGVSVSVDKDHITVTGPKGSLSQFTMPGIKVSTTGNQVLVERADDERVKRSKHGLMRMLIKKMVDGVRQGFERKLEMNGVSYRVTQHVTDLKFFLGFSHILLYKLPAVVVLSGEQNFITVRGFYKKQFGHLGAEIRAL